MVQIETAEFDSPIGPLGLAAEAGILIAVTFNGLSPLRDWAHRVLGVKSTGGSAISLRPISMTMSSQ